VAQRLCEATRSVLGVDGASLSLSAFADEPRTVIASTGKIATGLEDAEDVLGIGPISSAATAGTAVLLAPSDAAEPWAGLVAELTGRPRPPWVAAVPLGAGDASVGVLLVHAERAEPVRRLAWIGDVASAVTLLLVAHPATRVELGLGRADATNQAVGFLMSLHHIDPGTALAMLRARAFATGARLGDAAQRVIDSRGLDDDLS
jgi:hypothetical protein